MSSIKLFAVVLLGAFVANCTSAVRYVPGDTTGDIVVMREVPGAGDVVDFARVYLGAPYQLGATGPGRFDCSGLVYRVYFEALNIKLPRTSHAMFKSTVRINSPREGDLVFFKTGISWRVNHVGIYIGNGDFIHSSTSLGVIISSLEESYYKESLVGFGRVVQ